MNVKHLATLQTALHYCVPTAVGVYRGGCVVASPGSCRGSDVCLWHLFSISGKVSAREMCNNQCMDEPSPYL